MANFLGILCSKIIEIGTFLTELLKVKRGRTFLEAQLTCVLCHSGTRQSAVGEKPRDAPCSHVNAV